MHIEILLLSLSIIANLILGLIVLFRSYRSLYGWFFVLTVFSVALWAVGDIIILSAKTPFLISFGERLFYTAPMFIPVSILLFSLKFGSQQKLSKALVTLIVVPLIVGASVVALHPEYLANGVAVTSGLNIPRPKTPGFIIYSFHYTIYFLATYVVLYYKIKRSRGISKIQLVYTMYGVLIASIPAQITNLSLPLLGTENAIWLGPVFTLTFIGSVTYAIVKHHLFDIRLVLARAITYATTLGFSAAFYGFIILSAARLWFGLELSLGGQIFLSLSTGIATLAFQPAKRFFDHHTNKLFYQDAYDPQELYDQLNRKLASSLDIKYLMTQTISIIETSLKPVSIFIELEEAKLSQRIFSPHQLDLNSKEQRLIHGLASHFPHKIIVADRIEGTSHENLKVFMQRNNIAVIVRLTQNIQRGETGLGNLVLGIKKSGNPYTSQDIRVLGTVANELVVAIQNGLRYEEIQAFNATLQNKVEDATQALKRTNKKLVALDDAKDEFISMASHQLRTPLTSIKGYISMLLEGDLGTLNETQKKALKESFDSSQRMVFLISDFLNVSRIRTGRFIIEPTPTNLCEIVSSELSQLNDMARVRQVSLSFTPPKSFPVVMLDENKIRQVMMNMIDNAIFYTPSGGAISISLEIDKQELAFKVVDNGIGVPTADKHRLFTKFFRASNAQRARPDGTGLGLFMAQKVVHEQGGKVIFESVETKGSTFGFRFPLAKIQIK